MVEKERDVSYYRLSNGIVVVNTPKSFKFLGGVGDKIKKGRPFLEVDGEEYYYPKDVQLIEVEKTKEYIGILKEI